MRKGKSICIFSSKGGSGKTTTVLNLAGIFSMQNKKVLIVDFDLFNGGIAAYLNLDIKNTIYNIYEDFIDKKFNSLEKYILKYNENIDVLASPKDPRQGGKITSNIVELVLSKGIYEYDYILIDTDHSLSEFNVSLLDSVDELIITLVNDLVALKNTRNLMKIFLDAGINKHRVLLNEFINPYKKYYSMYDMKTMIRANIDYKIDSNFFIKTIDNYASDGKILTLEKNFIKAFPKIYKSYLSICKDISEDKYER